MLPTNNNNNNNNNNNIFSPIVGSLLLLLLLANHGVIPTSTATPMPPKPISYDSLQTNKKADLSSCRVIYFQQPLDHFSFSVNIQTYQQRVFICDPGNLEGKVQRGISSADNTNIFFYTGNEADVELYVNNTGLMWENAVAFNAILVFAEHRYFGKSRPFPNEPMPKGNDKLKYLNTDQALADYATLIYAMKTQSNSNSFFEKGDTSSFPSLGFEKKTPQEKQLWRRLLKRNFGRMKNNNNNNNNETKPPTILSIAINEKAAVTGFGGSYGGMLCSWMRLKYPSALNAGCIAASAPIIDFFNMNPPINFNFFSKIVTDDCGVIGGLPTNNCQININKVMKRLSDSSNTQVDFDSFTKGLGLCHPINSYNDAMTAVNSFIGNIGNMAMGSYPYPSDYMLFGKGVLPAYPLRFACSNTGLSRNPQDFINDEMSLFRAFAKGMSIFYNAGDFNNNFNNNNNNNKCINVRQSVNEASEIVDYLWGYLSCTTLVMPQTSNGDLSNGGDMFIPQPFNIKQVTQACEEQYGVIPNPYWVQTSYGGRGLVRQASKVFFSNGELDPWRGGGITSNNNNINNNNYLNSNNTINNNNDNNNNNNINNNINPSIILDIVRGGGHHMDLMFSNVQDRLTNVGDVRGAELRAIIQWINEARQQN